MAQRGTSGVVARPKYRGRGAAWYLRRGGALVADVDGGGRALEDVKRLGCRAEVRRHLAPGPGAMSEIFDMGSYGLARLDLVS